MHPVHTKEKPVWGLTAEQGGTFTEEHCDFYTLSTYTRDVCSLNLQLRLDNKIES